MSEVTDKMQEDIQCLENEIKEREAYFYNELEPKLMKIMNKILTRNMFTPHYTSYQEGRLKIKFSRFKRSGSRRRKDVIRRIEIRYKYKTVLLYEHNEFSKKNNLEKFHSCDWLPLIDSFCERVSQMMQEEDYKNYLKRLKKRQKKLKTKCENLKVLCDE